MKEGYFICTSSEDGTTIDGPFTEAELQEQFKPDREGYTRYGRNPRFVPSVPPSDKGCWLCEDDAVVLIKGIIVMPTVEAVVTRYKF